MLSVTAEDFLVVQKEVSDLLKGRILVGHALHNDLKVRAMLVCLCVSHALHGDLKVGARLMCLC